MIRLLIKEWGGVKIMHGRTDGNNQHLLEDWVYHHLQQHYMYTQHNCIEVICTNSKEVSIKIYNKIKIHPCSKKKLEWPGAASVQRVRSELFFFSFRQGWIEVKRPRHHYIIMTQANPRKAVKKFNTSDKKIKIIQLTSLYHTQRAQHQHHFSRSPDTGKCEKPPPVVQSTLNLLPFIGRQLERVPESQRFVSSCWHDPTTILESLEWK